MDAVLSDKFNRIDAALSTLVESITTNNPSPQCAVDLNAADDELCSGLDLLSQHTANHARILALRAEAEVLETQLKSSISTLASLRHELFEAPATTLPENSRPVPFDELLQYAKTISRYTVPPTYREPIPKGDIEDKEKEDGGSNGAPSNGTGTPTAANAPAATEEAGKEIAEGEDEAPKQVTAEQAEWLKKLNEVRHPWVPWPDNEKIRRGNLMSIQELLDRKKDPWIPQEAAKEQEQGEEQEKPQLWQQEQARQVPQSAVRRESNVPTARDEPQEPKQFEGFDMFNIDENE